MTLSPKDRSARGRQANATATPAYRVLADELRDFIARNAHALPIDLPTEAELVEKHGVSRQTVRRAYQELVVDGLVERVKGRGTRAIAAGRYFRSTGSIEDLLALSMHSELEVVQGLREVSDPLNARRLALEFDSVSQMLVLRRQDGEAFSVHRISLPPSIAVHLRPSDIAPNGRRRRMAGTVLAIVEQRAGITMDTVRQEIVAVGAPADVAALIGIAPGTPVLQVERTFYERANQRPVQHTTSWFDSTKYVYRIHLRRGGR